MGDEARHHHYVPQAYLRGFGFKRTKHWMVVVHDLKHGRTFETNVRNVCGERDFMRVEVEGHPPTKLEHELGQFEGQACDAIRRVVQSGTFEGDDKTQVLNLMALLGVRHPDRRENIRQFIETTSKRVLDLALATKERWEGQMKELEASTGKKYEKTYEEIREFHEGGRYRVVVPRERLIGMELEVFDTVLNLLWNRKWTLYITDGKHGHFVTTDDPLVLSFTEPHKVPAWMSPGHGLKNTEVFFPLTKNGFLIGRWDRGGHTEVARQDFIGSVNAHVIEHSSGQVFSDSRKLLYFDPLLRLHWDEKLVDRVMTPPTPEELAQFRARFAEPNEQLPEESVAAKQAP